MEKEEIRFGVMITIIALIFSMGAASLIYSNNIRMQVDFFEISHNMTALDEKAQKIVDKYDKDASSEAILGAGMLVLGGYLLYNTYRQFKNKKITSDDDS